MKFLCPSCERLADASRFRVQGGTLVLTCEKCGADNATDIPSAAESSAPTAVVVPFRPAVAPAPPLQPAMPEDPLAVPDGYCPKCIASRQPDALACGQCGLVFANFRAEEHLPSPVLVSRWEQLLEHWGHVESHDAFLHDVSVIGELAAAGRLYRIRLARSPGDPMAERGRDEVIRRATAAATLVAGSLPKPQAGLKWKAAVAALLGGVALGALIFFLRMLSRLHL